MVKTISSVELRTSIKEVLNEVAVGNNQFVVEKAGEPSAAIIGMESFRLLQAVLQELEMSSYDEAVDPAIGLFSGSVDLAEQAKALLARNINGLSGWSQKEVSA